MALIKLKFSPEMEELILQGKKCCTTRDEKKGEEGDVFRVGNRIYRIIQIDKRMHPYECSDFKIEGFESWKELKSELERIYPHIIKQVECIADIGRPGSEVYVHFFQYFESGCTDFGYSGQCIAKETCKVGEYCSKKKWINL